MRNCGYWLVCGGGLVLQLGCWGDAASLDGEGDVSVDRRGPALPVEEPGEGAALDEPVASAEPLPPGEPATPGEPPPFNGPGSSCAALSQFRVDTPLNDTRGTGFSALEMLSIFNEQGSGTLTWLDGTTTTLSIAVLAASNISRVDDPPRGAGYCEPFREVHVQLRIESADGRLAEDFGCELVATGYDGHIESIWLRDARVPLQELQGSLAVPSDWLIAGHTERRVDFDTAWVAPDATNPFCLPSDVPSTDALVACNVYTGVVRFFSSTPFDAVEGSPSFDYSREVVGTWVLTR